MSRITSCSRAESRSSSSSWAATSAAAVPNASSTNPANRGENTASPPATRRTASDSSAPSIDLVTYPRAPALITDTTSSAASETDSARNRTSGNRSAHARNTSAPPPPEPPGRCTSSNTTSGRVRRTTSIASGTSSASPTTCKSEANSARTPVRTNRWSSTSTTRNGELVVSSIRSSFRRHPQVDLRAAAGLAADGGGAAVPAHPADDRISQAVPVLAHLVRVETLAPVPHVYLRARGTDLGIQRHRRPGVDHGVDERFPGGGHQVRGAAVRDGVSHRDYLDGGAV